MEEVVFIKPKNHLWKFIRPQLFAYGIGVVGDCAVHASLIVMQAFAWKYLFDASTKLNGDLLVKSSLFFLIPIVLLVTASPIFYYVYQMAVKKIMNAIMLAVFKKINRLPLSFFESNHSGYLVSLFNNDVRTIRSIFDSQIKNILFHIIISVGSILSMMYLDWKIGLFLVGVGFISAILVSLFSKPLRSVSDIIQRRLGVRTARLLDVLAGITVIKMLNIHAVITRRFNRVNDGLVQLENTRGDRVAKLESVNYLIAFFNFGGAFAVGAFMLSNGMIGLGTLTALVQLSVSISSSFSQIGVTIAQLQTSLAGFRRLSELFGQSEKQSNEHCLPSNWKQAPFALSFEHVSFQFPGDDRLVLEELNFYLEGIGITAIVGKSGSGKSTIAKLIMGVHAPTNGQILINGEHYYGYHWLELISYVPQKVFLFEGTIEENIRLGNLHASREDIIRAAIEANAHPFITELKDGYSTKIVDGGGNLSVGQKQRIALARALVRDSKILVLDEATSALDSTSEGLIHKAISEVSKTRKVVVITHKLERILDADQILVVENGRIVEEGSATQLRNANGIFKELLSV